MTREERMPAIEPDRVLGDLYKLRTFGTYKTGVHRPTFSSDDVAARNWFAEQCTAAGLETTIDGIGNIFGKSKATGAKALSGSHLESQNHAGWLDGPLGCVYALEAARAIREAGGDAGVDVVVFCDEEGHFGTFLGSKSFTGLLTDEDIDKARNKNDGTPIREALAQAGYAGRPRVDDRARTLQAFFEAHIEQGDTLETEKLRIGVVTAIVAIWQYAFHRDRRAEPRRHHLDDAAARCRPGAGAAACGDRQTLPGDLRPAHGVDHRTDRARSRQPQHHSGPRRVAVPVARRRPGGARPIACRAVPPGRGG